MSKKNKPERESKIITELRKKNRKLSIQNQQLRKQLRLQEDVSNIDPFEDEENDLSAIAKIKLKDSDESFQCLKCGAYTDNLFELMNKVYYKCSCGSKGRISG